MTAEDFFRTHLSWNERISGIIGKTHSHVDEHILTRNPPISFLENGKIDIDTLYKEEIQTSATSRPYDDYFNCLLETFDDEIYDISTFCDVGCSTGWLVRNMNAYTDAYGIEYFQFQKEHADPSIKDKIIITDIRDPLNLQRKFDLVNCTEVAEHIDPSRLDIFLDNIRKISGRYLTLSWSNMYAPQDAPPQHVSPLFAEDVHKIMNAWGYEFQQRKTQKFLHASQKYDKFYYWWRDGYSIWKVKNH